MNGDIETQIRSSLEEMAAVAPLANPEHPRPTGSPARRRPHIDVKTLTLVGCLLVLIGTLVAIGVGTRHHRSPHSIPAATTSTLPPTTTSLPQPGPYVVPNLVGLNALQAVGELQAAGLTNSIDNLNCPGSFGEGKVVGQNPPAGFRAASDSRVNLRISCSGAAGTVTVPTGAVNTSVANASAIMSAVGLKVTERYLSSTSPADTVLAVTPSAGSLVRNGSTVVLTVSRGPSAVRVPNVVGLSQAQARAVLGQAGLNVGSVTAIRSTSVRAGVVVSQDPAADSSLPSGSSVDLAVSSGP